MSRSSDAKLYAAKGTDALWYRGWDLQETERERFRQISRASLQAKLRAVRGDCDAPKHPIPRPRLDPNQLMPELSPNGLKALSLFSGGGGLDLGFDRAGYEHVCSYDILSFAGDMLRKARPTWDIKSGLEAGDVTQVQWEQYRGQVDVLHGGPPCQPFSHAGSRQGADDVRDMFPELVRAVLAIRPRAFIAENVSGLATKRFESYVASTILEPLSGDYAISQFVLNASDFGVPQRRRRVFFVGFLESKAFKAFRIPEPTHQWPSGSPNARRTMGAREALGLPDIGEDNLAPTLRSGLTGPRHSTSVVNSSTAMKQWNLLEIWPNGVAPDRNAAAAFVAKNNHFRLSIADCKILQGFPEAWPISPPVYQALGLIGNSVAPPMAFAVARCVAKALIKSR